jgi:hypothetical protein
VKRPTAFVAILAAAAIVPFGCTIPTSNGGGSEPADRATPSGPPITTPGAGPTAAPSAAGLDALAPCTLLNETEQVELKLRAGRDRMNGGHRVCAFPAADQTFVVAVSIYPDEGLDEIIPDTILKGPTQVGAHSAVQHHEGNSVCVVSFAVGKSASVDVGTATAKQAKNATPDDLARSCQVTQRAAELVEPRLP